MSGYKYNLDKTIRTLDTIERYGQTTPDGNQIIVVYIDDVEYINKKGDWTSQGYRWAVVEPNLSEDEVYLWLLNNGLSKVPFLRPDTGS